MIIEVLFIIAFCCLMIAVVAGLEFVFDRLGLFPILYRVFGLKEGEGDGKKLS